MNRRDPRLTMKIFDEVDSLQTTQRTFCNLNVALCYLFHLYLFVSVASASAMLRILRSSSIKFLPAGVKKIVFNFAFSNYVTLGWTQSSGTIQSEIISL